MTLMSLTAYAATHGVAKQSAAEWKTRGYLAMVDDKVDVEASDAKMKSAAKGRFRTKAHGGRRTEGVRGAIDRPALGYVAGEKVAMPAPPAAPHVGWAWAGNPTNPLSKGVADLLAIGGEEAEQEIVGIIDYSEWENACTYVGWDRWPDAVAELIAADLGLTDDVEKVRAVLQRHVRARLLNALELEPVDLADPRLEPR